MREDGGRCQDGPHLPPFYGNILIQFWRMDRYLLGAMEHAEPQEPMNDDHAAESDLQRRLARFRRRVEAEGRPRSVRFIDRAIEDAAKDTSDGA